MKATTINLGSRLTLLVAICVGMVTAVPNGFAGSMRAGREITYPTRFEVTPPQVRGDGVVTPPTVTPGSFETRETGASLRTPGTIGVTRHVTRGRDAVRILFDDGSRAQFITGVVTVFKGQRYRGLGWQEQGYGVLNLHTQEITHYRPSS